MEKSKKVVKSKKDVKAVKMLKQAKAINPLTGRKVGTKGDIVGVAILSSKDPVKAFGAALKCVEGFFKESNHSTDPARVRRHTMSWIDFLRENHGKEFKDTLPAAEYSKAFRIANKPAASTDKKAKAPAAKKAKVAKKAPVKKPVEKKEETQAATGSLDEAAKL